MKMPYLMLMALSLIGCAQSERKMITMDLVYRYPSSHTNNQPYYNIIKYYASQSKLSLKEGQLVYFDGQNYYIFPQKATLFSIHDPETDEEIRRQSIILLKNEAEKIIRDKH